MFYFILLLFSLSLPNKVKAGTPIRSLNIESASLCPNNNKFIGPLTHLTVYNSGGAVIANVEANITETVKAPIGIEIVGQKCDMQDRGCVPISGVSFPDLCLTTDAMYTQMIFSKLQPPVDKCPVEKGLYIMKDAAIEHEKWIQMIPFPTGKYKFKFNVYNLKAGKRRMLTCWKLVFKIQMSSKRNVASKTTKPKS